MDLFPLSNLSKLSKLSNLSKPILRRVFCVGVSCKDSGDVFLWRLGDLDQLTEHLSPLHLHTPRVLSLRKHGFVQTWASPKFHGLADYYQIIVFTVFK